MTRIRQIIDPEAVIDAYKRIEALPARYTFLKREDGLDFCCGMTAICLAHGLAEREEFNTMARINVLTRALGWTGAEVQSFATGFDDETTDDDWLDPQFYALGRACGKAVFDWWTTV